MTTQKVVKNVAKGLALGILWPAAVGYVAGKRVSEFISNISHESLDTARGWTESGGDRAKAWSNRIPVTIEQPRARSLGAAAGNPRGTRKQSWFAEKFEAVWQRVKDNLGFCLACGAEAYCVEPDARRYTCESCGKPHVYGAEELLLMGVGI